MVVTAQAQRRMYEGRKKTFSFTLDPWVDEVLTTLIERGVYVNKSHVVDDAIRQLAQRHDITPAAATEGEASK